ncbi:MAG: hypothetical protein ABEJ06_00590 [Haloarculaceae archaeon]
MLTWVPALFAGVFGTLCLLGGVGWHRGGLRLDARLAGDAVEARALRDGVALAVCTVGAGTMLLGVGYLVRMRSLAARATGTGRSALVVALTGPVPVSRLGGVVLVAGFVLLVGSLLVPVGDALRRLYRDN